jgi:CheY-like chemotaxis protein
MAASHKGTILVVDDEEIMREILETLLTREGYDVRLATSGAEGLELARALPFDAAIVDIMMPGLDGIATLDDLSDEERRIRLHHQAVQERRSAGRGPKRDGAAAPCP